MILRTPKLEELDEATKLCLRSKAYWGYDADFMAACVEELTLTENDIVPGLLIVAAGDIGLLGVAQISNDEDEWYLEKLFVDPKAMGKGIGRQLFDWCCNQASRFGADELIIEADPGAVGFYLSMNCKEAGVAPSGSIPDRVLPRLTFQLI